MSRCLVHYLIYQRKVFSQHTLRRRVFNEACVGVGVFGFGGSLWVLCSALWSQCLCVASDVQWVVLKGRAADWCSVISSLCCALLVFFLCSSSHPPISSSPVTRRWRSGCQRCGGRGEIQSDCGSFVSHLAATSAAHLWPAHFRQQDGTLKPQFPGQSRGGLCKWGERKICLFRIFFTANFESAIQVWCYLEKINYICWVVQTPGKMICHLIWKLPPAAWY